MKNNFILIIFLLMNLLSCSCAQNSSNSITNKRYNEYKKNFENKFIDHFPANIPSGLDRSSLFSDRDEKKNDFILMLYEYGVSAQETSIIINKLKDKYIAKYNSSDSCLLIVNRFETKETLENYEMPKISDSTLLNRPCYSSKYPIPNFANYGEANSNAGTSWLDDSFTIYILESKGVDSWGKEFDMGPAPQMPNTWRNGFSKGIAISEKNKTIIYWTVIW